MFEQQTEVRFRTEVPLLQQSKQSRTFNFQMQEQHRIS